jgi:hypothetical protein
MDFVSEEEAANQNERDRGATRWNRRFKPIGEARAALETELLEAEVLWGEATRSPFQTLFDLENKLFGAILEQLDAVDPETEDDLNEPDKRRARSAILYRRTKDEFTAELLAGVSGVEHLLRPHIAQGMPPNQRLKLPARVD